MHNLDMRQLVAPGRFKSDGVPYCPARAILIPFLACRSEVAFCHMRRGLCPQCRR